MPSLTLDIVSKIDTETVLSVDRLQSLYLYGVQVQDKSGHSIPDSTYEFFLKSAQSEIEKFLGIKLTKQIIEENLDFYLDEFKNWGYVQTCYPVLKPFQLIGFLGNVRQIEYPSGWLTSRKTSDGETFYRRIFIVPVQSSEIVTQGASILYSGVLPYTALTSFRNIPNYWTCVYCTGFEKVPQDLLDLIGKLAAINILNIAGDLVLGKSALSSISLSIDGLSQSTSSSPSAYGPRIKALKDEIATSTKRLRTYYRGITTSAM